MVVVVLVILVVKGLVVMLVFNMSIIKLEFCF